MRLIIPILLFLLWTSAAIAGPCQLLRKFFAVERAESTYIERELFNQGILLERAEIGMNKTRSLRVSLEGDSDLNSFARYLNWSYGGLRLHLNPEMSGAGAYYFFEHNIGLGKNFLNDLMAGKPLGDISTTLRHELVHARLTRQNFSGKRTIFDGELKVTAGVFEDGFPDYNDRFSFQELATMGWQTFFHLRLAKKSAAQGKEFQSEMYNVQRRLRRWSIFYNRYQSVMPILAREIQNGRFRVGFSNITKEGQKVILNMIYKPYAFGYLRPRLDGRQTVAELRQEAIANFFYSYKNRHKLSQLNEQMLEIGRLVDKGTHPESIKVSELRKQFMASVD